jgi:hypothetical protein
MKMILTSFSPKMIEKIGMVGFRKVSLDAVDFTENFDFVQAAHPGAAQLLSHFMRKEIEVDRSPVTLKSGDKGFIILVNYRINPGEEVSDNPEDYTVYFFTVE